MKLFFSSMLLSMIIISGAESRDISHAATSEISSISLQMSQTVNKSDQVLWAKANSNTSKPPKNHPPAQPTILHALSQLFSLHHNHNSYSTGISSIQPTISPAIESNNRRALTTLPSMSSVTSQISGKNAFFHGIGSIISPVSHAIHTALQLSHNLISGTKILIKYILQQSSQSGNTIPSLIPSESVLANAVGKIPVILVHGGFSNADTMRLYYDSFEKAGIPAYAPTFGNGPHDLISILVPSIGGTDSIKTSERELSQVIDQVQKVTGSPKVDLVGLSQGGLIMRDYLVHDKKDNVEAVATLGGAIHGTTYSGLEDALQKIPKPLEFLFNKLSGIILGPGNVDIATTSALVHELNQYPDTKPGINYLNIASDTDNTITPWNQASFLKPGPGAHVTNIETHSIPGVPANFNHEQYGDIQSIVNTVVKYIQTHGELGPGIPAENKNSLTPAGNTPVTTPPTISLLN